MMFRIRSSGRSDRRDIPATKMQWRRLLSYLRAYKLRLLLAAVGLFLASALQPGLSRR